MIPADSLAVPIGTRPNGLVVALFTAIALAAVVASMVVLYRGMKRFDPATRRWLAGFLEMGTSQSSTRLVGVLSFMFATMLCAMIVVAVIVGAWFNVPALANPAGTLTGLLIAVIGLLFANACVALGLRKPGDIAPAGTADQGPLVPTPPTGHEP